MGLAIEPGAPQATAQPCAPYSPPGLEAPLGHRLASTCAPTDRSGTVHNRAAHRRAASDAQTESRSNCPETLPTWTTLSLSCSHSCAAAQRVEGCENDSAEHAADLPATCSLADLPTTCSLADLPAMPANAVLATNPTPNLEAATKQLGHRASHYEQGQNPHFGLRLAARVAQRRRAIEQATP